MSDKVLCEMQDLVNIADAVRSATGSTEHFNVEQLSTQATAIISSGGSGVDGFSPTVDVDQIDGGHRVSITDKDGTKTFDVMDGKDGEDGTGGSSVQADWNTNDETDLSYIYNRTHYEAPPSFDITWDGVIGDRFALDMSTFGFPGIYFVKVDDRVPTLEEMVGALWTSNTDDDMNYIMPENCDTSTYPGVYDIDSYVIVCYDSDKLNAALGLPSGVIGNGIYFQAQPDNNFYITRFVGRDNSKKLDTKYLPEGYPYETEPKFNIIWNGDMTGRTTLDMTALGFEGFYFVKVSDDVFSIEDLVGTKYYFNWNHDGDAWEIYELNIDTSTYPGAYSIDQQIVIVYDQSQINAAFGLPDDYLTNGVYFVASPTQKLYVARFTGKSEVKKIDEKYLPNMSVDLSNYYSKSEIDARIANAIGGAIGGSY